MIPDYSRALLEIAQQCLSDSERWFPDNRHRKDEALLAYFTLALAGEAGEVANAVKKVWRGTHSLEQSRDDIVGEIVDVFIYLMNLVYVLDFDLYAEYQKKRAICELRWGPTQDIGTIPEQREGHWLLDKG